MSRQCLMIFATAKKRRNRPENSTLKLIRMRINCEKFTLVTLVRYSFLFAKWKCKTNETLKRNKMKRWDCKTEIKVCKSEKETWNDKTSYSLILATINFSLATIYFISFFGEKKKEDPNGIRPTPFMHMHNTVLYLSARCKWWNTQTRKLETK